MSERVLVAGAGAIGSLLAGHLSRVCEVSVLTRRPEHADALNAQGLRVSGRAELHGAVTASSDPGELPEPELVFVCCKGTDLAPLAGTLHGHFPAARMMTLQNGLGAEEVLGAQGGWPILSAVTFMSGTRHSDTHVEYILDTETWIGPGRGTSFDDAEAAAALLRSAGLKAKAFRDLRPAQWSKLIFNASVNSVAALTGLPHEPRFAAREHFSDLGHLLFDLIAEGKAIAAGAGVELAEDPWEMNVHATQRGAAHYPSMLEDVEARRPTEIDQITGALVREGERAGVAAPLHTALYRLIKAKEASFR
jgi:2-dehydropantoate 2-reductase